MGLLFGDTYIDRSTTVNADPGLAQATEQLACATEKVAKANQNIADAINEDKVTISHARYAELNNKRKTLISIKTETLMRMCSLFLVANAEDYKLYKKNFYMMQQRKFTMFEEGFADGFSVAINHKDNTSFLYKRSDREPMYLDYETMKDLGHDILQFVNPVYIKHTVGEAKITGKEYNSLLRDEDLLDNVYIDAVEVLPKIMFELLNPNRDKGNIKNHDTFFRCVLSKGENERFGFKGYPTLIFNSNGFNFVIDYNESIKINKI